MRFVYHRTRPRTRWRTWFAFYPTVVHQNPDETIWVWLSFYRWRYDEVGHVERQEYWGGADPYVVPFGGDI